MPGEGMCVASAAVCVFRYLAGVSVCHPGWYCVCLHNGVVDLKAFIVVGRDRHGGALAYLAAEVAVRPVYAYEVLKGGYVPEDDLSAVAIEENVAACSESGTEGEKLFERCGVADRQPASRASAPAWDACSHAGHLVKNGDRVSVNPSRSTSSLSSSRLDWLCAAVAWPSSAPYYAHRAPGRRTS